MLAVLGGGCAAVELDGRTNAAVAMGSAFPVGELARLARVNSLTHLRAQQSARETK